MEDQDLGVSVKQASRIWGLQNTGFKRPPGHLALLTDFRRSNVKDLYWQDRGDLAVPGLLAADGELSSVSQPGGLAPGRQPAQVTLFFLGFSQSQCRGQNRQNRNFFRKIKETLIERAKS